MPVLNAALSILSPEGSILIYRGERGRVLRFFLDRSPEWTEVMEAGIALHSTVVHARLSEARRQYDEDPIEDRDIRKGLTGRNIKGYRFRDGFTPIEDEA